MSVSLTHYSASTANRSLLDIFPGKSTSLSELAKRSLYCNTTLALVKLVVINQGVWKQVQR